MTEDPPTQPTAAVGGGGRLRGWGRRLLRWVGLAVGLSVVGLVVSVVVLLFPYVRDDYVLDGVVRVVALDWRDFGRDKALERLRFEYAAQGIGDHARPTDCVLEEVEDERVVRCAWAVSILLGPERALPLRFRSVARVTATGDLR